MQILVANDSKSNLTIISNTLHKLGHDVIQASTGQQAIELFSQQRPDLILLAVVMEGMDGFETARRIRQISSDDWIPIIFLSASLDDESMAKGMNAGGDDFLTQPFSEMTLTTKITAMQRIADMRNKLFETTEKLYRLSAIDVLTGVYNRLQFDRSLKEILSDSDRYEHKIALLYLDLDNFKNVNDTFGHHVGDLLLIEVAKRLKTCFRENDFIARLGGDEFAVILNEIENAKEVVTVTEKMINTISRDYNLERHQLRQSVSVGIAIYPDARTNNENIILNADIALYHAKTSGRNTFKFFTQELNEQYKQHINITEALKFALEKNELYLTYQPIFHLKTRKISGLEVILCWRHPKYGNISPKVFVTNAEESGLMVKMGSWLLKRACVESMDWPLEKYSHFRFALNVSSSQLLNDHFMGELEDMMKHTHLSASRLELELTESTVISFATKFIIERIQSLHDMGVHISIKDFGTSYSSLMSLKQLAIDSLKIDKLFIEDMLIEQNADVIVSSLILIGQNLNLNIIAEGIQSDEQLTYLITKECPQGQGTLLCPPLKAEEIQKYLEAELLESHV